MFKPSNIPMLKCSKKRLPLAEENEPCGMWLELTGGTQGWPGPQKLNLEI